MSTIHQLRSSGIAHSRAAKHIRKTPAVSKECLATCVYLYTLSLECLLKAKLLSRNSMLSLDQLKTTHPKQYAWIMTAKGHEVARLAKALSLESVLKAEGASMPAGGVWSSMTARGRPYSLRYGRENPTIASASLEMDAIESLEKPLLHGLLKGVR